MITSDFLFKFDLLYVKLNLKNIDLIQFDMQDTIRLQSSFNAICSIKVAFHTFANLHMACILINFQGHPVYFLAKVFFDGKILTRKRADIQICTTMNVHNKVYLENLLQFLFQEKNNFVKNSKETATTHNSSVKYLLGQ